MSQEFYAVIGARIKAKREALGWTQEGLGREIGLSREAVSTLETGRHRILLHHFVNIADVLGIPTEELLEDYATKAQPQAEAEKYAASEGQKMLEGLRNHPEWLRDIVGGNEVIFNTLSGLKKLSRGSGCLEAQRKAAITGLEAISSLATVESLLAMEVLKGKLAEKKNPRKQEPHQKTRELFHNCGQKIVFVMDNA